MRKHEVDRVTVQVRKQYFWSSPFRLHLCRCSGIDGLERLIDDLWKYAEIADYRDSAIFAESNRMRKSAENRSEWIGR